MPDRVPMAAPGAAQGAAQGAARGAAGFAADPGIPSRIEACEAREYHRADRIQAHGLLLAFDPDTGRIARISANAGPLLGAGQPVGALLGSAWSALFAPESVDRINRAVASHRRGASVGRGGLVLTVVGRPGVAVDAFLYPSGGLFCIEIEPPGGVDPGPEIGRLSGRFFDMVETIGRANGASAQLAGLVCEALREVTALDRVYFCRFDRHGHGHVLAASGNGGLPSLLDHHFPATDVPQAARRIYVANPFRTIPDAEAEPVPILGGDGRPMDLSLSFCRAIAPTHLRYLRNMGVRASASFSVTADHVLEAIFGGHHREPRLLSVRQLATCQHLVELYQTRFEYLRIREERGMLKDRVEALHALSARFLLADGDFGGFVAANHERFRDLMEADDLACRFEGQVYSGSALSPSQASLLLDFASRRLALAPDVAHTACLGDEEPSLAPLCPAVAGILAIPLDLTGANLLVWSRAETVMAEQWSGNPAQPAVFGEQGAVGPRTSFAAYALEVRGSSRAWSSAVISLARQSRHAFGQVLAAHYERRMRAAAEQANALKSDFIATISHELRSPLHAIIGLSKVLLEAEDGLSPAIRRRYADTIRDSGERLLGLIEDLLDLSRLEAGKMRFDPTADDMGVTIERAIGEVAALAAARRIGIDNRPLGRVARCPHDPARMRQVMINLLSNAIRFSPPGGRVTVTADTTASGPGGALLLVEVSDQGPGIPDDERESIFGRFVQSSRTRGSGGGSGLGLAICREIVEAHRGRIRAANTVAGGASLLLSLPLLISPPAVTGPTVITGPTVLTGPTVVTGLAPILGAAAEDPP